MECAEIPHSSYCLQSLSEWSHISLSLVAVTEFFEWKRDPALPIVSLESVFSELRHVAPKRLESQRAHSDHKAI